MPRKRWPISFIPYYMTEPGHWTSPPPGEAIKVLKSSGYDGVEWMLGQHFDGPEGAKRLVGQTRKEGLLVSDLMCWQDVVVRDRATRRRRTRLLQSMIRAAGDVSVPLVNVFTGPMTWDSNASRIGRDLTEGEAWTAVTETMSELLDVAERHDVTVTVEPVFGMLVHDYYTLGELLAHFDSKHLAVNMDPSHLVLYGNDPAWAVRRLGDNVKHVHVKDAFGRPGVFGETFSFPFLGEGVIDWTAFFSALRETGYSGSLSLEFENDRYLKNVCDGDWSMAARLLRERLRRFVDDDEDDDSQHLTKE